MNSSVYTDSILNKHITFHDIIHEMKKVHTLIVTLNTINVNMYFVKNINTLSFILQFRMRLESLLNLSDKHTKKNNKILCMRRVYNNVLNKFKTLLLPVYINDTLDVLKNKVMLHNIPFLHKEVSLTIRIVDTIPIEFPQEIVVQQSVQEPEEIINYRKINYDGSKTSSGHHVHFTCTNCFDRKTNEPAIGVKFGFDTIDYFLELLICCINDATVDQLKWSYQKNCVDSSVELGKYLVRFEMFDHYEFSLDLVLQHISSICYINSSSAKITHWLTHGFNSKVVRNFIYDINVCNIDAVPTLVFEKYQSALCKKIRQLITQVTDSKFPYMTFHCYRNECSYCSIVEKRNLRKVFKCTKCNRSEFCTLCGKTSHGNNPCNMTSDQATLEFLSKNTKPCPHCHAHVEKDGGCNHMECIKCRTHFCWLCGIIYTRNTLTTHYINMNPYGMCMGNNQVAQHNINNLNSDDESDDDNNYYDNIVFHGQQHQQNNDELPDLMELLNNGAINLLYPVPVVLQPNAEPIDNRIIVYRQPNANPEQPNDEHIIVFQQPNADPEQPNANLAQLNQIELDLMLAMQLQQEENEA